jgi:hypothetical protein
MWLHFKIRQNYHYHRKGYAKVTNNKKGKAEMTLPFVIL